MFFFLLLCSAFGYALQGALMAGIYRRFDRLNAIAYRGLSLGITMSPLLLFVPSNTGISLYSVFFHYVIACILAAFGNWCFAGVYTCFFVGIANALCVGFCSIMSMVFSYILLGDRVNLYQGSLALLLIVFLVATAATRNRQASLVSLPNADRIILGVFLALLGGIFLGLAFTLVGYLSRNVHPLLIAWLWEFGIGVFAISIVYGRFVIGRQFGVNDLIKPRENNLPRDEIIKIALYSSPTILGTGCYAVALTLGPMPIAAALSATAVIFSTLFGYFFFKERLNNLQLSLLVINGLLIALIRLVI